MHAKVTLTLLLVGLVFVSSLLYAADITASTAGSGSATSNGISSTASGTKPSGTANTVDSASTTSGTSVTSANGISKAANTGGTSTGANGITTTATSDGTASTAVHGNAITTTSAGKTATSASGNSGPTATSSGSTSGTGQSATSATARKAPTATAINAAKLQVIGQVLSTAGEAATCQTNLVSTVAGALSQLSSNTTDLQTQMTIVQQDNTRLQTYASAGNLTAFNKYLRETYNKDVSTLQHLWNAELRTSSLNASAMSALKQSFEAAKATSQSCELVALKAYADGKVADFNLTLDHYQNVSDALAGKGLDTSSLNAIVNNASAAIIMPLKNAIDGATNSSQVRNALDMYCMFNGCKNGVNYHLAARFDIQKLELIAEKLQSINSTAINQTAVAQGLSALSDAANALASVGTSAYTTATHDAVWDSIKAAVEDLKHIAK